MTEGDGSPSSPPSAPPGTVEHRKLGNRTAVKIVFQQQFDFIPKIRDYVVGTLLAYRASREFADRCGVVVSELTENAIKYSVPGSDITLELELKLDSDAPFFRCSIANDSTKPQIRDLKLALQQVNAGDPMTAYVLLLREAASENGIPVKVGLGRLRAEAEAWLRLDVVENRRVRLTAGFPDRRTGEKKPPKEILERRAKPTKRRAQAFITLTHWAIVVALGVALASGLRLGWGYQDSLLSGPRRAWWSWLDAISPQGDMLWLHVVSSWAMAVFCVLYVGYLLLTRESRRVALSSKDFTTVWTALKQRSFWKNKLALWSANVIVYWIAFVFIAVIFATGIALYQMDWKADRLFAGYGTTRLLHAAFSYLLIPYVVLHGVLEWCFGVFWAIFKAAFHWPRIRLGLAATAIALVNIGAVYQWDQHRTPLRALRIAAQDAPKLDGVGEELVWQKANSSVISTVKGVNFPDGRVDIEVRALHDGERVYFRFRWADDAVSGMRYPLLKTAEGWKVLGKGFFANDEVDWYEDKLSVYLSDVPNRGCTATCHLGSNPLSAPRPATWGLHFSPDQSVGDVWHWKYVRTNPMLERAGEPAFVDDMYFGPALPVPEDPKARYSGGYFDDPQPKGHGYRYNFDRSKLDPDKPIDQQVVTPLFLPRNMEAIAADGTDFTKATKAEWWIFPEEGIPYQPALDTFPIGTLMTNIVVQPFAGDRADVRGKAAWKDGHWTLELARVFDTKSKYDVAFGYERPVFISVAAYQHVQTRHSEHLKPIQVVLER